MVEDEAKNAYDNKSQKIGPGHYQGNSHTKSIGQEEKNSEIKICHYTRGYA